MCAEMCVRVPKEPVSFFTRLHCAESWRRWELRAWFYGVVLKNDRFLVLEPIYIYMCVCMWVFKYSVYSYIHIHNLCVCACIHQRFKELNKKGRRRVKNSFCCFFLRGQFLCWFLAWYHVHPFALYSQQFGTRTSTFWQKHTLSL